MEIRRKFFSTKDVSKGQPCKVGQNPARDECIPASGKVSSSKTPTEKEGKTRPGFIGTQRKEDGSYVDSSGKNLPEEIQQRIRSLRLPPAWKDVQISENSDSDLQALGKDAKGRYQYVYSAAHSERQSAAKFNRVKQFVKSLPSLTSAVRRDLEKGGVEGDNAALILLMRKTGFRVGSEADTKAAKEALGASTLTDKNVKINGDEITFDFIGKKGVSIKQKIKDRELAAILRPRLKRGGKLFQTTDNKVRQYMKKATGEDFKPKDLRTVVAAETALNAMQSMDFPKNEKEFKKNRTIVGKQVAEKLGNTPTVALASYIPPEVFSQWKSQLI